MTPSIVEPACPAYPAESKTSSPLALAFTLSTWRLWQSEPVESAGHWPGGQVLPHQGGNADVDFLPLMQRRRLSPLARAALAVAWPCEAATESLPAVFCSNHGESRAYLGLLHDLAQAGEISPTAFSLSVHNAIAGQYRLCRESRAPYVALAGGTEGVFAAFLEAAGLLAEGAGEVLVVAYEQPLPSEFGADGRGPRQTVALALRLGDAGQGEPCLRIERHPAKDAPGACATCRLEEFAAAFAAGRRTGLSRGSIADWHWSLGDD